MTLARITFGKGMVEVALGCDQVFRGWNCIVWYSIRLRIMRTMLHHHLSLTVLWKFPLFAIKVVRKLISSSPLFILGVQYNLPSTRNSISSGLLTK